MVISSVLTCFVASQAYADEPTPSEPTPSEPRHLQVTYQGEGEQLIVEGRVYSQDSQGGLCLQRDDGGLTIVQADELISAREASTPFHPITQDDLAARLQSELGDSFQIYSTPHYVVAYSTSREYARWLSSLLERLHKAFVNYWARQGLALHEPEFPLIVLVYADEASYRQASADELGAAAGVVGYYSLLTNRISMYDLTGVEQRRAAAGGRTTMRDINRMAAQPAVAPLVATIVHEATHQVAFNTGVMQRFADLPMWLVEGMAIYFEAPDLSSGRGWRGIGKVNYPRLQTFGEHARGWSADRLQNLVSDDQRFRKSDTALAAYAEAWALNYFLIKQHPREYRSYLEQQAAQPPFIEQEAGDRLQQFEDHFGPLEPLSEEFFRTLLRTD